MQQLKFDLTVGLAELDRACRLVPGDPLGPATRGPERSDAATREPMPGQAAPPRFSAADLERLAAASSGVACECPRHLSDLVSALTAFELYCAQCVALSPEDSAPLYVEMMGGADKILAKGRELHDQAKYLKATEIQNKLVQAERDKRDDQNMLPAVF